MGVIARLFKNLSSDHGVTRSNTVKAELLFFASRQVILRALDKLKNPIASARDRLKHGGLN